MHKAVSLWRLCKVMSDKVSPFPSTTYTQYWILTKIELILITTKFSLVIGLRQDAISHQPIIQFNWHLVKTQLTHFRLWNWWNTKKHCCLNSNKFTTVVANAYTDSKSVLFRKHHSIHVSFQFSCVWIAPFSHGFLIRYVATIWCGLADLLPIMQEIPRQSDRRFPLCILPDFLVPSFPQTPKDCNKITLLMHFQNFQQLEYDRWWDLIKIPNISSVHPYTTSTYPLIQSHHSAFSQIWTALLHPLIGVPLILKTMITKRGTTRTLYPFSHQTLSRWYTCPNNSPNENLHSLCGTLIFQIFI